MEQNLDNFKIFSILTLTFNCGFSGALDLEKLQKMLNGKKELWKSSVQHIKTFEATWVTLQPLEGRKYFIKIGRHFS